MMLDFQKVLVHVTVHRNKVFLRQAHLTSKLTCYIYSQIIVYLHIPVFNLSLI